MQIHDLVGLRGKKAKRIGRGGKRGSFSGRGIKGQKARSGRRIRPQIREVIKKIHKRRGYGRSRAQSLGASVKPLIINIGMIEKEFNNGDKITPQLLLERGLLKIRKGGLRSGMPKIKILGGGKKLTKKLVFDKSLLMSESAKIQADVE